VIGVALRLVIDIAAYRTFPCGHIIAPSICNDIIILPHQTPGAQCFPG
jgi:hypothetical protein